MNNVRVLIIKYSPSTAALKLARERKGIFPFTPVNGTLPPIEDMLQPIKREK